MKGAAGRIATAALVYGIALASAVGVGCAALGFSCHLSPGASLIIGVAIAALASCATGLVLMGGVLAPAAMILRRIGWLYWWSVLLAAAGTAVLPLLLVCLGGGCSSSGFLPLAGSLVFASLCGGLFLWWTWLRQHASQPILGRLAAHSPAVKLGLVFVGLYASLIAAAAVFVATSSGDMSGIVFYYIALPWPQVGFWLLGQSGLDAGLLAGLLLNAAIAFGVGYGLARLPKVLRAAGAARRESA